jgi:hypothetical protein
MSRLKSHNGYKAEYSDAIGSFGPIELFDVLNGNEKSTKKIMSLAGDEVQSTFSNVLDAHKWLPFAAEKYKISEKLSDYVVVPVSIMTTELPNRNGVAFSFEELTSFNHEYGKIAYKTWQAKPTHWEHNNSDVSKAKGVILDAAMRRIPRFEGDLWQVVLLNAFDRSKDATLANKILKREATGYSMGAWVKDYECSICAKTVKGLNGKSCGHVTKGKPEYALYNGKLAYFRAVEPIGFECSSVEVPAYVQAVNPNYLEE